MSVVDGQQRLTTNYKAYCNHPDVKNIVLDIGKGKFLQKDDTIRKNQIPVGILLNKDDSVLIRYTEGHGCLSSPNIVNALLQIRNKIKTYQYTINFATDLSEDEQISWFGVLNNAGSRVSDIQMNFSKLKAHGIDIYSQYTNVCRNKVLDYGYDYFTPQTTNSSYPIVALNPAYELLILGRHQNNCAPIPPDDKSKQLCHLKPDELKMCFDKTLCALDSTLQFIEDHNLQKHNRSDYINYLLGYFIFHSNITAEQEEQLVHWYNNINFRNTSNTARRKIYTDLLQL